MALLNAKSIDTTTGSLFQKIILYSIPLILSTLIQQLFNAVDIVVLGNMADSTAVAAVSATTPITSLIVSTFVGISTGTRVVLARFIGARDEENTHSVTDSSIIFSLATGALIAAVGFIFAPWFLNITNCPAECYNGALIYVRIYMLSAPFVMLYNFGSAVITADGDTQRPLYYIMIAGVTNVALNIILCLCLEEKVAAVAIATVASQVISALLVSFRLLSMDGACRVSIRKMRLEMGALGRVLAAGLPMALVHSLFPLSNLQIQSAINSHGVAAIAGNGAVATIESVVSALTGPLGTSASVFIGQNIGAKKHDRVKRSFWMCMLFALVIGGGIGAFTYLTGKFWLSLIVGADAAAIEYGLTRMFCTTLFHVIAAINGVFASAILAHGFSVASSINAIFSVFVFRIIWMQTVYPKSGTFWSIVVCFIISWALRMLVNIVLYSAIWRHYRKKTCPSPRKD